MLALERLLALFAVIAVGLCAGVGARVIWRACSPPPTDIDDLLNGKRGQSRVIGRIHSRDGWQSSAGSPEDKHIH